jgi:hypothetical protein
MVGGAALSPSESQERRIDQIVKIGGLKSSDEPAGRNTCPTRQVDERY